MNQTYSVSRRKLKKKINYDNYVNIDTGESVSSELNNGESMCIEVPTGEVVLTFKEFVMTNALLEWKILWDMPPVDFRRYHFMTCFLHTPFNIVMSKNNRPHTPETLSKELQLSKCETTRLVNRLTENGLLLYTNIPESGYEKKVYIINPFVSRKRNSINEKLLTLFPDFQNKFPDFLNKKSTPSKTKKSTSKKLTSIQPEQAN